MHPNSGVLASQALDSWRSGHYANCITSLDKLQTQLFGDGNTAKDSEPAPGNGNPSVHLKLQYNRTLAAFATSEKHDLAGLLSQLRTLKEQFSSGLPSSVADGDDSNNKADPREEEDATVTPEMALLLYNEAVVLVQLKRYNSAIKVLENIFHYIEPVDEPVALCVCFFLLDLYTRTGWSRSGKMLDQLLAKSEAVVSFLEKPHSFNGLLKRPANGDPSEEDGNNGGKPKSNAAAKRRGGGQQNVSADDKARQSTKEVVEFKFRLHLYKAKLRMLESNVKGAKKELKSALEIFQHELKGTATGFTGGAGTGKSTQQQQQQGHVDSHPRWLYTGLELDPVLVGPGNEIPGANYNTPALVLKANLEYLRQNYKKSIKLLTSCSKSGLHQGIYLNNMACIHHQLRQHNCASLYLTRAMKAYQPPPNTRDNLPIKGTSYAPEVMYNLGLQLLLSNKPQLAYSCFSEATLSLYNRPKLWLRIAECVVRTFEDAMQTHVGTDFSGNASGAISSRSLSKHINSAGPLSRIHVNGDASGTPFVSTFVDQVSTTENIQNTLAEGPNNAQTDEFKAMLPGAVRQVEILGENRAVVAADQSKTATTPANLSLDYLPNLGVETSNALVSTSYKPPSLETGLQATYNCIHLLDAQETVQKANEASFMKPNTVSTTPRKENQKESGANDAGAAGDQDADDGADSDGEGDSSQQHRAVEDSVAIRLSALLCRCYIALSLNNASLAIQTGLEYLALSDQCAASNQGGSPSPAQTALAHTYCAEGFLHIGDEASAVKHAAEAFKLKESIDMESNSNGGSGVDAKVNATFPKPSQSQLLRCAMCTNMAAIHLAKDELNEAERVLHMALHFLPNSTEALRGLLFLYLKRGQNGAALQLLKTRRAVPLAAVGK